MRRSFHLCASLLLIMMWLWRFPISDTLSGQPSAMLVALQFHDDPESRLARGEKLLLACAGIFELELLNGVSDTTATHIVAAKQLLQQSRQLPQNALQAVHGLGIKRAHELARFIDLSTPCPLSNSGALRTPPAEPPTRTMADPLKE